MKKKIIIIVIVLLVILVTMYLVDMYMMLHNKAVIFSTWGHKYSWQENNYQVVEIEDRTKVEGYTCVMALEKIYEDNENEYYFSCIKSSDIIVKYANGYEENVKQALIGAHITLQDLVNWEIGYITEKKEDTNLQSFVATVLEEGTTYMLVEPAEGENERKSSDKIVINYGEEHLDYLYGVGTKVVVYYNGYIMETYPAQINANEIYVLK